MKRKHIADQYAWLNASDWNHFNLTQEHVTDWERVQREKEQAEKQRREAEAKQAKFNW